MSISYTLVDNEYRDLLKKNIYPFMDTANIPAYIPEDFILDIIIYAQGEYAMPFYIKTIDPDIIFENKNSLQLRFVDNNNKPLAVAHLTADTDACYLYSENGIPAGSLVYDKKGYAKVKASLKTKINLNRNAMPLLPACCYATKGKTFLNIKTPNSVYTDEINIKAKRGVHFTEENDAIAINLYGEDYIDNAPVKSINYHKVDHMWLAAHPDSDLRVITENTGLLISTKRELSV